MKSPHHKLLIRSTTSEEKEQQDFDHKTAQVVADFLDRLEGKKPIARADLPEPTEDQKRRIPYVMAAQKPCLLCEGVPYVVGNWRIPDSLSRGRKDAVIFFSLCVVCKSMQGVLQLVTQELLSRVNGAEVKSPLIRTQ